MPIPYSAAKDVYTDTLYLAMSPIQPTSAVPSPSRSGHSTCSSPCSLSTQLLNGNTCMGTGPGIPECVCEARGQAWLAVYVSEAPSLQLF